MISTKKLIHALRESHPWLFDTAAFTLLEMSVVITIIALALGGVVVGRNMVRSSEVNATVTKVAEYKSAILEFRDRYYALPGDMPNAVDIWGKRSSSNSCDGSSSQVGQNTSTGTGTETCNGNGDDQVGGLGGEWAFEIQRAWKHLENSGLIKEGGFTGTQGPGGNWDFVPGLNMPKTPIKGGGYVIRYYGAINDSDYFVGDYGNTMIVGKPPVNSNNVPRFGLFTSEEALNVDSKMDDGKPNTGKIVTRRNQDFGDTNPDSIFCSTGSTNSGAWEAVEYDLSQGSEPTCPLIFKLGF